MIDLTIKVQDDRALQRQLRKFQDIEKELADVIGEWAEETLSSELAGMGNYAAAPAGSDYVRKGVLGAGWSWRRSGKTAVNFSNPVRYARYVVGDAAGQGQARVHAGRWWLFNRKVADRMPRLTEMVKARIARIAR
jgi:hypothetical protein